MCYVLAKSLPLNQRTILPGSCSSCYQFTTCKHSLPPPGDCLPRSLCLLTCLSVCHLQYSKGYEWVSMTCCTTVAVGTNDQSIRFWWWSGSGFASRMFYWIPYHCDMGYKRRYCKVNVSTSSFWSMTIRIYLEYDPDQNPDDIYQDQDNQIKKMIIYHRHILSWLYQWEFSKTAEYTCI